MASIPRLLRRSASYRLSGINLVSNTHSVIFQPINNTRIILIYVVSARLSRQGPVGNFAQPFGIVSAYLGHLHCLISLIIALLLCLLFFQRPICISEMDFRCSPSLSRPDVRTASSRCFPSVILLRISSTTYRRKMEESKELLSII